jgi:hypothetical protein
VIYHRSVARWGRTIGLVVATLLGGCLPQSHEPIAPASEAIVEPRLAGLRVGQHDGQAIYVHVLQRDLGMMDVVTVSHEADGRGDWDLYEAYVTVAGPQHYINLQPSGTRGANETETPEPYFFATYEFSGSDRLSVRFLSNQALSAAIGANRLAGTVDHDLSGPSVTLTDSAAHIRDFLATASPRGLFDEAIELRRLNQPPA